MRVLKVAFPLIAVFFSASLLAADGCPNLSGEYFCENVHGVEYNVNITQWDSVKGTAYTLSYDIERYDIIETVSIITDGVKRDSRGRRVWAHCLGGVLVKHFRTSNAGEVSSGVYFMDDNDNLNVLLSVSVRKGYHEHIEGSCSRK